MRVRNSYNRVIAIFLVLFLLIQMVATVHAEPAEDAVTEDVSGTIYISTADELLEFAENCSLDTWSQGKNVVLKADISLKDTEFLSIPTFGGTFDGGGHTISGLSVSDSLMPAALFGILQQHAVVKNLNVSGTVSPSGDGRIVGGIVGENSGTVENCIFTGTVSGEQNIGGITGINAQDGRIINCRISGKVSGDSMTGGIAGYNLGEISSCQSDAFVNTESVDPLINPEDINLDFLTDLSKLSTLDTSMSSTDTGGITGYSSGILADCVNNGTVGYPHIGYNVGGVAGRSCGHLYGCSNNADVYGRKDVGGIVGQMEPYIDMNLTEDTLSKLQQQMDELNTMINTALEDADRGVGTVTSRLNSMANYLDAAAAAAKNIQTTGSISSNVVSSGQASGNGNATVTPPQAEAGGSVESSGEASAEVSPPSAEAGGSTSTEGEVHAGLSTGSVSGSNSGSASGTLSSSTQIRLNTSLYQLSAAINGMSGQMRALNGEVAGVSGTLTEDMKAINEQTNSISDTFFNALFGVEGETTGDILEDTSEVDIDAVTYGKVESNLNDGAVSGDIGVGGIAGTMAIEYELDPEDDLTSNVSGRNRREFELKAILQNCTNKGKVLAKRSYIGSVCGNMDLGLITDCKGYGDTESENGDYVGGIAGVTSGTVRNCYAKCTLKGRKYVGGIVGSGVSADQSGTSSSVTGCYALVSIPEYEQYVGGISGAYEGEFSGNYYVAEDVAAINRLSYSGKAEPITYADLMNVENIPEEFRSLTLQFVADDEVLKSATFNYGDSLEDNIYPELPRKDGYYAHWDITELDDLCFDTVVTAVYSQYHTALTGTQMRKDDRPIFFVEGEFEDGDEVKVRELAKTPGELGVLSESLEDALESYFSFVKERTLPDMEISCEIVEQWMIQIPDDGLSTHSIRYLPKKGKTDYLDIYVKQNGEWKKMETETVGSYLRFQVKGTPAEIAIVSTFPVWWIWGLLFVLLALIILALIRLIKKIRRRRAARAKLCEPEVPNLPIVTAESDELLRRIELAEKDLAKAKSELMALKAGKKEPVKEPEEKKILPEKGTKKKKKKGLLIFLIIILVILGCVIAGVILFMGSDVKKGMDAYRLIQEYAEQDELSMELSVQADIGKKHIDTQAQMTRTESEGHQVTHVEQSGISLYYCDKSVYLEDGKAFQVNELFPDYLTIMDQMVELYQAVSISESSRDGGKIYSITAEGENARELLEILVPEIAGQLSVAQVVQIDLKEKNQKLKALQFSANGTLNNDSKTDISVIAELTAKEYDRTAAKIPSKVQQAVKKGKSETEGELTDELFRLLSAWSEIEQREVLAAKIQVAADCGPIVLDDNLQIYQTDVEDQEIGCIRKGEVSIYFTENTICNSEGATVAKEDETLADAAKLLEIAYQTCLNGDLSCTESDGAYIYELRLDQKGMESVAYAIAPQAEELNISFESGSIQITVEDESIGSIHCSCSGSVNVASLDVPVSISSDLLINDADEELDFIVPEAVVQALK